jgi:hypothetical protein
MNRPHSALPAALAPAPPLEALRTYWALNQVRVTKALELLRRHLPRKVQSQAVVRQLQEIWMAETKKDALAAFDAFAEKLAVAGSGRNVTASGDCETAPLPNVYLCISL